MDRLDRLDRMAAAVREQVALGRLVPLGGPGDTAWITESAAVGALRRAAAGLSGVRLREVEVLPADRDAGQVPDAAPAGALPHLPVRVEAAFEAAADEPLPLTAQRLRDVLWEAAHSGLGLAVEAVDLRITGLLEGGPAPLPAAVLEGVVVEHGPDGPAGAGREPAGGEPGSRAALDGAALAVPGVRRLTRRLAGLGAGVRVRDVPPGDPAARHVQVQIAVAPGRVPLHVARAVAETLTAAAAPGAPGAVTTVVVVTDVG